MRRAIVHRKDHLRKSFGVIPMLASGKARSGRLFLLGEKTGGSEDVHVEASCNE